jgi:hypothetical protein
MIRDLGTGLSKKRIRSPLEPLFSARSHSRLLSETRNNINVLHTPVLSMNVSGKPLLLEARNSNRFVAKQGTISMFVTGGSDCERNIFLNFLLCKILCYLVSHTGSFQCERYG